MGALAWAYTSAVTRTLDDYSEDAGYDAAWLGNTRFTLFRDRLDRVTSCGKYALQAGADAGEGIDLVHAELSEREIATMPLLPPDLVRRSDLNHSPGWRLGDLRFLLASSAFGKIDALPWPQKSPTKQRVAKQPNPDPDPTLFDGLADDEVAGLLELADDALDLTTLVSAHSLDAVSQRRELVLGLPRLNDPEESDSRGRVGDRQQAAHRLYGCGAVSRPWRRPGVLRCSPRRCFALDEPTALSVAARDESARTGPGAGVRTTRRGYRHRA